MSGTMPSQRVPQLGEVPRNWSNNNQYEALFLPLFKQNKTGDFETESDETKSEGPIEIEEVQVLKQPRRKIDTSIFELDNKKLKQMAPKVIKILKEEQERQLKQAFVNRRNLADDATQEQIDLA
ncbi:hypothetical protein HDU99_003903 [Rhizoclosmatium hyalinum]|nr:hypothetical protein HDU99_003903 [Rhizoclosmatium hyalinum]